MVLKQTLLFSYPLPHTHTHTKSFLCLQKCLLFSIIARSQTITEQSVATKANPSPRSAEWPYCSRGYSPWGVESFLHCVCLFSLFIWWTKGRAKVCVCTFHGSPAFCCGSLPLKKGYTKYLKFLKASLTLSQNKKNQPS